MVKARHRPRDLGLNCDFMALNRFAHRYRVARSFRGVALEQYAQETKDGYSGLFAVFLTWSAFEQYLKIAGWTQAESAEHLSTYDAASVVAEIRGLDPEYRFYSMIAAKTKHEASRQILAFIQGNDFNFTYLASSVRHIFAHGFLTPNVNKSRPRAVAEITSRVATLHLDILGAEFHWSSVNRNAPLTGSLTNAEADKRSMEYCAACGRASYLICLQLS